MAEPSKFQAVPARNRKTIEALKARLRAHSTTRDREPVFPDRHLHTILQSHRHDIRAAIEACEGVLDLFADLAEDYGKLSPKTGKDGAMGPAGPQGPQGDPGPCCQLVMQDGVTHPPVPLELEDGTDWLYADHFP